jgi:hypothetical protein
MLEQTEEINNGTNIFTPLTVRGNTNIIQGNLNINGNLNVDNWSIIRQLDMYNKAFFHGYTLHKNQINASNVSDVGLQNFHTASILCNGGTAILKNLVVGGDLHLLSNINIRNNINIDGNAIIKDQLIISNKDDSVSTFTGCAVFNGGIGISKNINIGHNIVIGDKNGLNSNNFGVDDNSIKDAKLSLSKPSTLQVQGAGFIKNDLYVGKNVNIVGNLTVHGSFTKLLTENIVADDPLIVLGANSTREHDNNPSGFVTKYGGLNSNSQYVHKFSGLIRMPNNFQQHNLWMEIDKPYNLVSNLDVNNDSISDEPLLKNSDGSFKQFNSKNNLSDLNIRNLATYGHVNIKGNINIDSSGFLKLPVGDMTNRPNLTDVSYRNTNGLLRLNIDKNNHGSKNGVLEMYYVKEGLRWDGSEFYKNQNYNPNLSDEEDIKLKGDAGWREIGPYILCNKNKDTRIEVENKELIEDQVISFYTNNKLRMSIFPDKSFNNKTSYHTQSVNKNVLEGGISMGKIPNPLYNIKGVILGELDITNINYNKFIYPSQVTINDLSIAQDKIINETNANASGLLLKINIINGDLDSIICVSSGTNYNSYDKLIINLDNQNLIPNRLELILQPEDLFILEDGLETHIGFNIPQSTLDIAGNLNISYNITSGDYIGINTDKCLLFSNELSDGSYEKPFRNYISCISNNINNILYIKEIRDEIEKTNNIIIPDANYNLNTICLKINDLLNNNSLINGYSFNYSIYIDDNKIIFKVTNFSNPLDYDINEKVIFLFSQPNSISNILGYKNIDYIIDYDNNILIGDFYLNEEGTNNLFNIKSNKLLNNNLTINVKDKKANINYNNKHNIKYNSIFTITQKNKFYLNFNAQQFINIQHEPNNYGPNLTSKFTFMSWININTLLTTKSTIYFQGTYLNNIFIHIYINNDRNLCISFSNSNPGLTYISTNTINLNIWTHIAITLTGIKFTGRTLKLYINGILDNTQFINEIILNKEIELNKNYYIGSFFNNSHSEYFNGYITDIIFYNEVKTDEYILNYNSLNNIDYFDNNINDSSLIFYLPPLEDDYINIEGIINKSVFNSNILNITLNSNNKFLEDKKLYINNTEIDNTNISYNQDFIILDNLDRSQIYHIHNEYKYSQIIQNNFDIYNIQFEGIIHNDNYEFDGIDDFFEISANIAPQLAGSDFTIEFWAKITSGTLGTILSQGIIADHQLLMINYTSNRINLDFNYGQAQFDISSLILNNFNHYAFVYNSSGNGSVLLYLNGIKQNPLAYYGGTNMRGQTSASGKITIGTNYDNNSYFQGELKHLRVYNDIRTESEIQNSITNLENGNYEPNLDDYSTNLNNMNNLILYIPMNLSDTNIYSNNIAIGNIVSLNRGTNIKLTIDPTKSIITQNTDETLSTFQYIFSDNTNINLPDDKSLKFNNTNQNEATQILIHNNYINGTIESYLDTINSANLGILYKASIEIQSYNTIGDNNIDVTLKYNVEKLQKYYNSVDVTQHYWILDVINISSSDTSLSNNDDINVIFQIFGEVMPVRDWILNSYIISDKTPDLDVTPANFCVNVQQDNTTQTEIYKLSNYENYRIGEQIILNDKRTGTGAKFIIEITNNKINKFIIQSSGDQNTKYYINDILTISRTQINGTGINNNPSSDLQIILFEENINSQGLIINMNYDSNSDSDQNYDIQKNILHFPDDIIDTPEKIYTPTIKTGGDIICSLIPNIKIIDVPTPNWNNDEYNLSYIHTQNVLDARDGPPTKLKTSISFVSNIIENSNFKPTSTNQSDPNYYYLTDDTNVTTGNSDDNSNQRQISDKAKFKIQVNDDGKITYIQALKGNNYRDGDTIRISGVPINDSDTKDLEILITSNVLDIFEPAIFEINGSTTTGNLSITLKEGTNLEGYLIGTKIKLTSPTNTNNTVTIQIICTGITQIQRGINWTPNYYDIKYNELHFNVQVYKENENNYVITKKRNDTNQSNLNSAQIIVLHDIHNSNEMNGATFDIEIDNDFVTTISINNRGIGYINNSILIISKDDIPGSSRDIQIQIFTENLDNIGLGQIINISTNNIIQHTLGANNTDNPLESLSTTLKKGTSIHLTINKYYTQIQGTNWAPNNIYIYKDNNDLSINPAIFKIDVDNNGIATAELDFIKNSLGIKNYSDTDIIIIPDQTILNNFDKIKINVIKGQFNKSNMIIYKYDIYGNIEIGIPNNIFNISYLITNNTTNFNDYTFLQNTPIIQKFIKFYNFTSNMGIQIPLSNNIIIEKINDILYGNKILDKTSTSTKIIYDVSKIFEKNIKIDVINYTAYVDLFIKKHNLETNNIINISNLLNTNSILYNDIKINYETPTEFSFNTLEHINNNNSDINIEFEKIIEITYDVDNNTNWNDGNFIYIDNNPPTVLLTNYNFINNMISNGTDTYLTTNQNQTFNYITQPEDITEYTGSGTNVKFKIVVINSFITYIYALNGINYAIGEEIIFNIKNDTILIGDYKINITEDCILNNKLKFNVNVINSQPTITLINPHQCPNYPLHHNIHIPKNISGKLINEYVTVHITSVPSLSISQFINPFWQSTTDLYFIDKLHKNNTYTEEIYYITQNISNISNITETEYIFNGTTDYLEIPSNIVPQLAGSEYTIEFWIYIDSTYRTEQKIFYQHNGSTDILQICIKEYNSQLYFYLYSGTGVKNWNLELSTHNSLDQWIHFAFVFDSSYTDGDASRHYIKLYRNGQYWSPNSGDNNSFFTTANSSISIGAYDNANYFKGFLKKIKIWNSVRSQIEIDESYYNKDHYYLDFLKQISYYPLLLYIPLNSYDTQTYSYFKHIYKDSPALFKINVDTDNNINIDLITHSSVNYYKNDEIIISNPLNIQIKQVNQSIKKVIIDFPDKHNLNITDYIFIYDYYNPLIKNDYLLMDDNLPYTIIIENQYKISFILSQFVSNNLDINLLQNKTYQIFKTVNNITYENNIITKFIPDNSYNNNSLYYSLNIPGNEILKIRSNGIIQLVTNQENNNTLINDNDKGTQIHLLANNYNSQIYLQSKESIKKDSIKIKSDNGGIDIQAKKNIIINSPLLSQESSNIYLNTNTDITNSINLLNFKGQDNAINLLSYFGNINIGGLEKDLTSIHSGKILIKSKGNIITLILNNNIDVQKYDIITQLDIINLQAIVYESNSHYNNKKQIKVKILNYGEFIKDDTNKPIIKNDIITNIYITDIISEGLKDAIIIETKHENEPTKGQNDIISVNNYNGNIDSINTNIDPYTLYNNNQIETLNDSSIKLRSINGGILLNSHYDKYVHLNGGKIAISSTKNTINSINLFTNSGINNSLETINIINFSGKLDNNNTNYPLSSAIQIISKNGGTKLEVHKNKQLLIQTKNFNNDGTHADETLGNHGYLNLIAKGLSDVGSNVPFNINSSGGINITSGERISIHSSNNDKNNSMILHSLGGINLKAENNNNIEAQDKMNLLSHGLNDVGLNVAFNIYSSAGINITSVQRTSIHTSNTDPNNSMILSSLGGINIYSRKNNNIISEDFTNIQSQNEDINLTTTTHKQTIITNEDQALLDGSGSFKVMGGAYISKDLIVNQNITVVGNFTVLGNKTEINTDTLIVDDPLIVVGANNVHSDNYYGGLAIKNSTGKIIINEHNNKLYITPDIDANNTKIITIQQGQYLISNIATIIRTGTHQNYYSTDLTTFTLTSYTIQLISNTIQFSHSDNFTLHYQNSNYDYPNNILSTIGFYQTQSDSNTYTGNKLNYYKFSGLVRKPTNNRFYLCKEQQNIITTSDNVDTSSPDFTLTNSTDLITTELEISKIIINDGTADKTSSPSDGTIQYNQKDASHLLNAYIKLYPTQDKKFISLARYSYVSLQFYFNDLSNQYQWGNRVSGQVDPDVAIFSKTILNRFMWVGEHNLYIKHIEINVDEYNNDTDRYYQIRIVDDSAISTDLINNNTIDNDDTGLLFKSNSDFTNTECLKISGSVDNKKEINVMQITSIMGLPYPPISNLYNNSTLLQIQGGLDKFIGLQLKSLNENSTHNEVTITLRGFTSYYDNSI